MCNFCYDSLLNPSSALWMEASSCFLFCFWCLLSRQSSLICVWPKFITKTIKIKIKQVKNEFPWLLLLFGWGFKTGETEKKKLPNFSLLLFVVFLLFALSPFLPGQQNECVHIQSLTKVFVHLKSVKMHHSKLGDWREHFDSYVRKIRLILQNKTRQIVKENTGENRPQNRSFWFEIHSYLRKGK